MREIGDRGSWRRHVGDEADANQPIASRWRRVVGVALALVAFGTTQAIAQGPFEPNDVHTQATGPTIAPATYDASLETSVDQDYFFLYAASDPGRALIGTLANHSQTTGDIEDYGRVVGITVYDNDGHEVDPDEDSTTGAGPGEQAAFRWKLAPGLYYVVISHGYNLLFMEAPKQPNVPYTLNLSSGGDSYEAVQQACSGASGIVADVRKLLANLRHHLQHARASHDKRDIRHYRKAGRDFEHRLARAERTRDSYCGIPQ